MTNTYYYERRESSLSSVSIGTVLVDHNIIGIVFEIQSLINTIMHFSTEQESSDSAESADKTRRPSASQALSGLMAYSSSSENSDDDVDS